MVAGGGNFLRTCSNCEECVAAANDGLVGVVGIQMQPTSAKDFRENVAWRSYALTGGASDSHSERLTHTRLPGAFSGFPRPRISHLFRLYGKQKGTYARAGFSCVHRRLSHATRSTGKSCQGLTRFNRPVSFEQRFSTQHSLKKFRPLRNKKISTERPERQSFEEFFANKMQLRKMQAFCWSGRRGS